MTLGLSVTRPSLGKQIVEDRMQNAVHREWAANAATVRYLTAGDGLIATLLTGSGAAYLFRSITSINTSSAPQW